LQFGQAVFCCLRAARKIHKSSASFAYCVRVTLRGLRCRALRIFDTRLTRVCVFRHRAPTKTWPTVFKQWLNVLWRKPQMPRFVTKATASNFHAGPNAKGRLTRDSLLCRSSVIAGDVGKRCRLWRTGPIRWLSRARNLTAPSIRMSLVQMVDSTETLDDMEALTGTTHQKGRAALHTDDASVARNQDQSD
jgi:hypothetical protein